MVADLADEQLIVPKMEIVNPFRWELGLLGVALFATLIGIFSNLTVATYLRAFAHALSKGP